MEVPSSYLLEWQYEINIGTIHLSSIYSTEVCILYSLYRIAWNLAIASASRDFGGMNVRGHEIS